MSIYRDEDGTKEAVGIKRGVVRVSESLTIGPLSKHFCFKFFLSGVSGDEMFPSNEERDHILCFDYDSFWSAILEPNYILPRKMV